MRPFLFLFCFVAASMGLQAQSVFDSLYGTRTSQVYFETGKHALSPKALATLDSVVTAYGALSGSKTVRITAHTDDVGSSTFNEELARKRAGSVSQWLQDHGIPADAIIGVESFGERQPQSSNQSEEGRSRNRRATVEVARTVKMTTWSGRILDKSTGKGVAATVIMRTKTRRDSIRTDTSGVYSVRVPKDSVVTIDAVAKNYFFESQTIKMFGSPELYQKYKISPNIELPPAKVGETVTLRNLFFVGNSAELLPVSKPELPKILKFMQINPGLRIEIGGHINRPYPKNHGYALKPNQTPAEYVMEKTEAWERSLSYERAQTIAKYLLQNGIDASRFESKGYNNSKMLFPHSNVESEMQQNRRVEIKIIE